MPGINVNEDGSIAVGGQKINKLYIKGMDLLDYKQPLLRRCRRIAMRA